MKTRAPLSELALMLQEARRRSPTAYSDISLYTGIPEKRVKAIAYGAEPEAWEKAVLPKVARG